MSDERRHISRRTVLAAGLTAVVSTAGCSAGGNATPTPTETESFGGARFAYKYTAESETLLIQFTGGATLTGGDVEVQNTRGKQVTWAELGSTAAGSSEEIQADATAELGPDVVNWDEPVKRDDTIRLIDIGKQPPVTLSEFVPAAVATSTATTTGSN